jgi:hypothetical protein
VSMAVIMRMRAVIMVMMMTGPAMIVADFNSCSRSQIDNRCFRAVRTAAAFTHANLPTTIGLLSSSFGHCGVGSKFRC